MSDSIRMLFGWWWMVPLVLSVIFYKQVLRLLGIIIIPEDSIGIINKKFRLFGDNKSLPNGKIIALKGEAGFQADTLAPGLYFWYWPWQYSVTAQKLDRKSTRLNSSH